MKRLLTLAGGLVLAAGFAAAQGIPAAYKIDGFKNPNNLGGHNLKATGSSAACEYCHAPHKLATTVDAPLLWNITVKTAAYTPYSSATMNASALSPTNSTVAGSAAYNSLLCLSCHDGTITNASFYNADAAGVSGTYTKDAPNVGSNGGQSLKDDHPVNFTYDATLATDDGGLRTPETTAQYGAYWVGGGSAKLPLYKNAAGSAGTVQCASCHNPHNSANSFLRVGNANSTLCAACHDNTL